MLYIFRYLKAFIIPLLLAIVFLFVQAFSDLSLPNYMSDIVDNGIQQNGVTDEAPEAISQNGMKLMQTFMTDNQKDKVKASYQLVDAEQYKDTYKKAEGQFYVRQDVSSSELKDLNSTFHKSSLGLFNALSDASKSQNKTAQPTEKKLDVTQLYKIQPVLDQLPETKKEAYRNQKADNDIMTKQLGVSLTQSFYNELGLDITKIQTAYIIKMGLFMLGIALIGGIATIMVSLLSSRIAAGLTRNLRRDVFKKIESFSFKEIDNFSTASLITRSTNDMTQIQQFFMIGIRMICYAPIMGAGGVIMAINKSNSMSWIIVIAVVILLIFIGIIMALAIPKFKIIQKLVDKVNLVSREFLSGLMVVRAFGTAEYEKKRFNVANRDLTDTNLFIGRVMSLMSPVMTLIMNGVSLVIVWVGAHRIADASMQVGDMMAFIQYTTQIIMAFLMLSFTFILIPRAAVSAGRIKEILETDLSIEDHQNTKEFTNQSGLVEFKNVSFKHDGAKEYALKNIDLVARPGEMTAIIGSTGAGKSTLINLLLRFYDTTNGEVLLDGVNIRDVKLESLRDRVALVPQKAALLKGTIRSNLRVGKEDATDEEMLLALDIAQATEFISQMDGLDTEISQNGSNLSGGQKQRLAIARAVLRDAEVLVFDDSFSALDARTEKQLRQALFNQQRGKTIIVIGQRVTSIMGAEQIIVLDKGEVVGRGTHEELLRTNKEYIEIASSQLSEEELA
ncbi:ABC transporter ATP-binding protein [Macrococcus brunensis]|uniref:ABC transporter ATP-binding protein n=1 Tax=Macrococcus brunensis TaxID=198483 RepID=UPI001EF116B0|nr:ABC transporter ATP-binding protein [Macrococcus brunensis]ULG72888.1 ABC transporter ATP-binding protein/permease [Macrococcus brunensis]